MKLSWDTLKFYLIGLFALNFFFLFLSHDNKSQAFSQFQQLSGDSDILLENHLVNLLSSEKRYIPPAEAHDELKNKNAPTTENLFTNNLPEPAIISLQVNSTTNNDSSIVADVGESIGQGSRPIPFPESGKMEMKLELIEKDISLAKEEEQMPSVIFSHKTSVVLIIIAMVTVGAMIASFVITREKRRAFIDGIDIESMDKYYLVKE